MKKSVLTLMLFMFSTFLFSIDKSSSPYDSFMGMKWGMNAKDFKEVFENRFDFKLQEYPEGFWFDGLVLGEIGDISPSLEFITKEDGIKWKEKNYSEFYFENVILVISSNEFEPLLDILKEKYGEPKSIKEYPILITIESQTKQSNSTWGNIFRSGFRFSSSSGVTSEQIQAVQKTVKWEKGDRRISLTHYLDGNGNVSILVFDRNDKKGSDIL